MTIINILILLYYYWISHIHNDVIIIIVIIYYCIYAFINLDAIIDTNDNNKQFIVLVLADPDIGFPLASTWTKLNEASFPNVIYFANSTVGTNSASKLGFDGSCIKIKIIYKIVLSI